MLASQGLGTEQVSEEWRPHDEPEGAAGLDRILCTACRAAQEPTGEEPCCSECLALDTWEEESSSPSTEQVGASAVMWLVAE